VANTLGDLTKRENRFGHQAGSANFPHALNLAFFKSFAETPGAGVSREGEDVILTNVLNFDVKVWDPTATTRNVGGEIVSPGDPGYDHTAGTAGAPGAYVDLFYTGDPASTLSRFSGPGHIKSKLRVGGTVTNATYDTWSFHYEHDGIDQASDAGITPGTIDEGTNDFDDNTNVVIDEMAERETSPPYPFPLRGVQIKIRVYEPFSQQVRETTIVESFMPE